MFATAAGVPALTHAGVRNLWRSATAKADTVSSRLEAKAAGQMTRQPRTTPLANRAPARSARDAMARDGTGCEGLVVRAAASDGVDPGGRPLAMPVGEYPAHD